MLFRVLGSIEVETDDGVVVTPSGARARALLSALLLQPGALVPTHRLVEAAGAGCSDAGTVGGRTRTGCTAGLPGPRTTVA